MRRLHLMPAGVFNKAGAVVGATPAYVGPSEAHRREIMALLRHQLHVNRGRAARLAPKLTHALTGPDARRNPKESLAEVLSEGSNVRAVLATPESWVVVDIDDRWACAYRLAKVEGTLVVAELRVYPRDNNLKTLELWDWIAEPLDFCGKIPASGLTARVLRKVRLGKITGGARQLANDLADAAPKLREAYPGLEWDLEHTLPTGPLGARRKSRLFDRFDPPRRGRPPRSDADYARIAAAYVAAGESGSRSPVQDAARTVGMATTTLRDAIHIARKRGFLTESRGQGYAGGELTPRAKNLLGDKQDVVSAAGHPRLQLGDK